MALLNIVLASIQKLSNKLSNQVRYLCQNRFKTQVLITNVKHKILHNPIKKLNNQIIKRNFRENILRLSQKKHKT